jgi:hypothetical protein
MTPPRKKPARKARRVKALTKAQCTTVLRPKNGPWTWPDVVYAMISDSFRVQKTLGLVAVNGEPLTFAYAVNFLESLYRCGYTVIPPRRPAK